MLFLFHLDWKNYSIQPQLAEANGFMARMVGDLGASARVIFNCASLGAGEKLLPFAGGDAQIDMDTLNYLRWHHRQVVDALRQDAGFCANRDVAEMLNTLRKNGHRVAAVLEGRTDDLENRLVESRTRDFFEDDVFGYDRVRNDLRRNFTLAALLTTAIDSADEDYEQTLVVADNATSVADAVTLQTRAVVGYVSPYTAWHEQVHRLNDMEAAGAHYTTSNSHMVTSLPWYISGQAESGARQVISQMTRRLQ